MTKNVKVKVPGSSANLGPGFDTLSVALSRHVWAANYGEDEPCDANHIAKIAFEYAGGKGDIWFSHELEPGRGLGFSAAARAAGVPVIYTTRRVNTGPVRSTFRDASPSEDSYDILDEFAPEDGELVIYKERASAFFGTPLIAHLTKLGIRSLIALGESTSGCVRATVVDGYSNGFHTALVEECTFDRSDLSHKVNLFDLHHKYADVMHVEEVLEHLNAMRRNTAAE